MLTERLKDRLYTYFITRLGMFDYTRGWLKGNCPVCGRENKFGVNLATNRSNCFVCSYNDRPILVVSKIEGLDWQGTLQFLGTFESLEYKEPEITEYERKPLKLPEGFRLLNEGVDYLAKLVRNYITNDRGLDINRLANKGFGYCVKGKLMGYLILPYYIKGQLVYYTTRRLLSIGPKFDNPPIEEFGIGKSTLLYNMDALYLYNTVYILESVFNAETIGDNTIAMGGKAIASWQLSTIIRSPVSNLIIILDPDAYLYAINLGMKLVDYKRVKIVNLPEGQDVNSYGRSSTLVKVRKVRYQLYKDLLKLKLDEEGAQYSRQ